MKKQKFLEKFPSHIFYGLGIGYGTDKFVDVFGSDGVTILMNGKPVGECKNVLSSVIVGDVGLARLHDGFVYPKFWQDHLEKHTAKNHTISLETSGCYELDVASKKRSSGVLHIHVKRGCQIEICERIKSSESLVLLICVTLEAGASLEYVSLPEQENESGILFVHRTFAVQEGAKVTHIDCVPKKTHSKTSTFAYLLGERASSFLYGLSYGLGNTMADIFHQTTHVAPQTVSDMQTESILGDSAHAIYRSMIDITETALGAKGSQKQHTTLLSAKTKIQSVPNLMVAQKDVECSHGVSISQPSKEVLFYLSSRGVSEKEAKKELVFAQCNTILSRISQEKIRKEVFGYINSLLQ